MRTAPMLDALDAFDKAMQIAERHRSTLKQTYGLTDAQIGMMTLARRRKPRSTMGQFAAATLAAKQRLEHGT